MSFIDQIYQSFWFQLFWLFAAIVIGALITNFRRQLLSRYRHLRALLLNSPARVGATYVSKYRDPPKTWLSKDVFDTLGTRLKTDKLRKLSSSDKSIGIFSERLGMPLTIFRIGLRGVAEFQYFVTLGSVSEQTVREKCFPGNGPYQQFIICDIRREGPITFPTVGDRTDKDLAAKVTVHDGQVNLVLEDPMQSVEALKKYFPW